MADTLDLSGGNNGCVKVEVPDAETDWKTKKTLTVYFAYRGGRLEITVYEPGNNFELATLQLPFMSKKK